MNIDIELTEEQVKYLKQFAAKQYEGATDNVLTAKPLHLVQTQEKQYIYDGGGNGCLDDVYINTDEYETSPFETARDIVLKYGKYKNEEDVLDFDDAFIAEEINGYVINDLEDYLAAYDVPDNVIENIETCSVDIRWRTVAYFFIRENALEYCNKQSHNLNNPRVYSVYRGYGNEAEYEPFFDLLMAIGEKLNADDSQSEPAAH